MQPQTFFQKYQTFFSIIIAGALIAGGIIITKTIPSQGSIAQPSNDTEESVKKDLLATAKKIGINTKQLAACLDNHSKESVINGAVMLSQKTGVNGTPTFVVIKRTFGPDDKVIDEKQWSIVGARDKSSILQSITDEKSPSDQGGNIVGEKVVLTDTDHYKGPARAQIVIVEYSDIDCPFCKAAKPVIDQILAEHPEYAFVYRHSPIVSRHPFAGYKAEATECVYDIGAYDDVPNEIVTGDAPFWEFLDIISK